MEKRRAHYDLRAIKAQMATISGLRMTVTARHDALRAGVTLQTAVAVIQSLADSGVIRPPIPLQSGPPVPEQTGPGIPL